MEKINIHNYEAFFLDFAEGNLSPDQILEVEAFLEAYPDLRDELASFEIITLPPSKSETNKWSELKKPSLEDLKSDSALRDTFFVRAIENQLNSFEEKILNELITDTVFKKEYELWQNAVLPSGNEAVVKHNLFQFGLDREVSEFNYEYYLTARTEGLLNTEQNAALEEFANAKPNGTRELEIADGLKLSPPKGVFYPDKDKLYKKDKPVLFIWLYRAAAIAAVLIFGVFIWINVSSPFAEKAPMANQEKHTPAQTTDSLKNTETESSDTLPNTEAQDEPLLEDWEVREPDPVEYAETNTKSEKSQPIKETTERKESILEKIEVSDVEDLVASHQSPELIEDTKDIQKDLDENLENSDKASTTKTFNSIPKYAENLLADKLNIPESEKDEIGLALARKLTARTGELLNAEYKKEETNTEGEESLTYTLRIGSFKISHTKAK